MESKESALEEGHQNASFVFCLGECEEFLLLHGDAIVFQDCE